jgi:hypothetical protein
MSDITKLHAALGELQAAIWECERREARLQIAFGRVEAYLSGNLDHREMGSVLLDVEVAIGWGEVR